MSDTQKPPLNNEHRYLALLALTSQELPAPEGTEPVNKDDGGNDVQSLVNQKLYERLDRDPAALEVFLRREKARAASAVRVQSTRPLLSLVERLAAFFGGSPLRYVSAAISIVVVAALSVLAIRQIDVDESLMAFVESGYEHVRLAPTEALRLPWEQPANSLGFSATTAEQAESSLQFASGLVRARRKLLGVADSGGDMSAYGALGEWNVLLWAAAISDPALNMEFWKSQRPVCERLAAADYDGDFADTAVAHLARVRAFIDLLARGQGMARNSRALADELTLFREQVAPRDPFAPPATAPNR